MSDILNSLKPFDRIFKGEQKPSYETAKDFISGSFESHFKQNTQSPYRTSIDLKDIVETIYEQFVNQPYSKNALMGSGYHDLLSHDSTHINKDNLVYTSRFILNELIDYARKNNVSVDLFETQITHSMDNIEKEIKRFDTYFDDISKLKFMCSKFHKLSKTTDTTRTEHEFNKIKNFLVSPNHELLILNCNNPTHYFMNSALFSEFENLMKIKESVIEKIKSDRINNNVLTLADNYVLHFDHLNDIQKALMEKQTIQKIEYTSAQKISGILLFSDGSLAFKEGSRDYKICKTAGEAINVVKDLYYSTIDYLLRKKPTLAKMFKLKLIEEDFSMRPMIGTINRYIENEPLVKAHLKEGYSDFLTDLMTNKSVEAFDDAFTMIAMKQKFHQFAYSITSKKYNELYNDESLSILKQLYDNKVDLKQLQEFVGKKIAAFENSEQFNAHLNKYLSIVNGFEIDLILESVNKTKAKIVSNKDNVLIVETNSYEQMNKLGSASWCIVRDESHYKNYTKDGNRQYIVFDFNKPSKDNDCMIGITLFPTGLHRNSHLKNDDSISAPNVIHHTDSIVIAQEKTFKELNEELRNRLFTKKRKTTKLNAGN